MGRFVVRQPDGKYAAFSTVVDDIIVYDCDTAQEAAEVAGVGTRVGTFNWSGVEWNTNDPKLWGEMLASRIQWHQPGWTNTTRIICDIIDRAAAKEPA